MIKTEKIISKIEKYASLDLAEDWDNSGWQIDLKHDYVNKVLVALSLTNDVLEQAITNDCDLIVTHHPVIFHKLDKIEDAVVIQAIKHNISVYSAHTNLDKTYGSTTDALAGVLGLKNLMPIGDYVKLSQMKDEISVDELIEKVKSTFNLEKIKVINPKDIKNVKNVALCAGGGGNYIKEIKDYDVDLYITGDIKFHDALNVHDFVVLDIGHFESERPVLETIKGLISKTDVEVIVADEKVPWRYL